MSLKYLLLSVLVYVLIGVPNAYAATNQVDFIYDNSGQRIARLVNGGDHTYYVSGIEITVKPGGNVEWRKDYGPAVRQKTSAGENLYFVASDHLGSTSQTYDTQGYVVSQQVYYPYGSTRTSQGILPSDRAYTGQVSDQDETGLYYYNARYYNPQMAIFTQADQANDGLNNYAYVGGNPINHTDPTGNCVDTPCAGGGQGYGNNYEQNEYEKACGVLGGGKYTDICNKYAPVLAMCKNLGGSVGMECYNTSWSAMNEEMKAPATPANIALEAGGVTVIAFLGGGFNLLGGVAVNAVGSAGSAATTATYQAAAACMNNSACNRALVLLGLVKPDPQTNETVTTAAAENISKASRRDTYAINVREQLNLDKNSSTQEIVDAAKQMGYTIVENAGNQLPGTAGAQVIYETRELLLRNSVNNTFIDVMEHEYVHILDAGRGLTTLQAEYRAYMATDYWSMPAAMQDEIVFRNQLAQRIWTSAKILPKYIIK